MAEIIATVDTEAGERLHDVTLTVRKVVRLNCGCDRHECDRPGGGTVHVIRRATGRCWNRACWPADSVEQSDRQRNELLRPVETVCVQEALL